MSNNELRKDYILDRWVVIATQRRRRPSDFIRVKREKKISSCPFCPGNEDMTPPAVLVYLRYNGRLIKDRDRDGSRHSNWIVRCVPNLYPAFTHPIDKKKGAENKFSKSLPAYGHHEVIIESPIHDEHPGTARIKQLTLVINAYIDRFKDLSSKEYIKYVSIFRNHGSEAGASLSHAHTQIIATPILPRIMKEEIEGAKEYLNETGKCIFCEIIRKEKESARFIWENNSFIVFAPWASMHPFEFWIFPKRHQSTILDMTQKEIDDLATTMRTCFGALKSLLSDPPYNFAFHMIPNRYFHWHIEVYPRLSIWAGFEKSTGIYINVFSPEEASLNLRRAIAEEENQIHQ